MQFLHLVSSPLLLHVFCSQTLQYSLAYLLLQYNLHLTGVVSWRINSRPRSGSLGGKELGVEQSWNNGKSGAKLDLTCSTTPGLPIHIIDHIRSANPCDWLPCRRAALPLVGYPHSLVYLHLPVVEGLIFCISATPHLGTSFPLFHAWKPPVNSISVPLLLEGIFIACGYC